MAVASSAQAHGAEGPDLGSLGTRQGDSAQRARTMPSNAKPLRFIDDAGPWGDWLSRSRTRPGYDGWVGAPSLSPKQPGDRATTDRRDAVPRARLARAGDLPTVSVPTGEDDALRELARARADAMSALNAAKCRLHALLLRHDRRDVGRATGGPAHRRGRAAVGGPTPAQPLVFHASVRAVHEPTARRQRLAQALPEQVNAGRWPPVGAELRPATSVTVCYCAGA
jgi:transposase